MFPCIKGVCTSVLQQKLLSASYWDIQRAGWLPALCSRNGGISMAKFLLPLGERDQNEVSVVHESEAGMAGCVFLTITLRSGIPWWQSPTRKTFGKVFLSFFFFSVTFGNLRKPSNSILGCLELDSSYVGRTPRHTLPLPLLRKRSQL